jgi:hypothetical protein
MVKCLPLSGCQWNTSGKHETNPTYPFVYGGSRAQNNDILRGAADTLLRLQRTGSSVHCVPAQATVASKGQNGDHDVMGGSGGERGAILPTPNQHWIGTQMRLHSNIWMQKHCSQLKALPPQRGRRLVGGERMSPLE